MAEIKILVEKAPETKGARIIAQDHGMHLWGQTSLASATLIVIENDNEVSLEANGGGSYTLKLK